MKKTLRHFSTQWLFALVVRLARLLRRKSRVDVVAALHRSAMSTVRKKNLYIVLWERAAKESADFVEQHIDDALLFWNRSVLWKYTVRKIEEQTLEGVCLEFGVFNGKSVNYFAKHLQGLNFVGFDSFEGLAEDWKGCFRWKGDFNLKGNLPAVRSNVTLVKGWFEQTLPEYCKEHLGKNSVRFVHIDSDTYNSSAIILKHLAKCFRPGLLLLFDEFVGYPNWKNGEFRAWQEACEKHRIKFRYLGFSPEQALIELIEIAR